jgi:hypothetical protein
LLGIHRWCSRLEAIANLSHDRLSKRNCGSLERPPAKPSSLELSAIDVHGNSSEFGLVNDCAEDSLRLVMDSIKSGADLHSQGYDIFADTICSIFKI